jgi:formylglycine-generating enzyme required for sulfatase activity
VSAGFANGLGVGFVMQKEWLDPFQRNSKQLRLDWYLGPDLSWEKPDVRDADGRNVHWEKKAIGGDPDAQLIQALNQMVVRKKHLLVLDQAGAGKTVLSLRIEFFLSHQKISPKIFNDTAPRLVVHWSGKLPPVEKSVPTLEDYLLADPLLHDVAKAKDPGGNEERWRQRIQETVRYALARERLVIIADAYDEFGKAQNELNQLFLQTINEVQWIFTSRDYAVNTEFLKGELFQLDHFDRIRISRFTEKQQDDYMKTAIGEVDWQESVGGRGKASDWEPLLGFPYILRAIAAQWEYALVRQGSPPKWESPSDLFSDTSEKLIERELKKDKYRNLIRTQSGVSKWRSHIQRALGAVAMEMAVDDHWGEVKGDDLVAIQDNVDKIWEGALQRFRDASKQRGISDDRIDRIWRISRKFITRLDLNNGATQGDIRADRISFYSRRVQEFYIARYLTDQATQNDLVGSPKKKSAIHWILNKGWEVVWQYALDMPVVSGKSWCVRREGYREFLRFLTHRPRQGRRPTELMMKAWCHAMKLDRRDATYHHDSQVKNHMTVRFADAMTDGIHQQFAALLRGDHGVEKQKIAKSLVDPEAYQILGEGSDSGLPGDTGTFLMGAERKLRKTLTLNRFGMRKLLLSNAQFQLFDDPYVGKEAKNRDRFGKDDQPAIYVSWFDAWWFSRFVGELEVEGQQYRVTLPTEAQWEYSARAGSEGDYFRAKKLDSEDKMRIINTFLMCLVRYMQWVFALIATKSYTEGKLSYLEVTEDDLHEYAHFGQAFKTGATLAVSSKLTNLWGLRMAGNAWQWTLDGWQDTLPGGRDPLVTGNLGSYRVSRGGRWGSLAADCRSAYRRRAVPMVRTDDRGFRLALSPSEVSRAAELQSGIKLD